MRNPLDVEVSLSGLSVIVQEKSAPENSPTPNFIEVEVIDGVSLGPREFRTVGGSTPGLLWISPVSQIPVAVKSSRPASLQITHVVFDFLSLLPVTESLALRGKRLQDTTQHRQFKTYASDILINVDVEDAAQRLRANFVDDRHLILIEGEYKRLKLWMTNSGSKPIREIWMVPGREDELWLESDESNDSSVGPSYATSSTETLLSSNSLRPREPYCLPLDDSGEASELAPGESMQVTLTLHAAHVGERDLGLLFVFREVCHHLGSWDIGLTGY